MKMINTLLITFILFSASCKKDCPQQSVITDEGEIIQEVSIQTNSSASLNEYIIRNTNENLVGAIVKIGNQTSFDTINFNHYSLIGKRITFTSGGIITKREVLINDQNKLVNCIIEKKDCGNTEVALSKHTWILTNKIPDDYEVVFSVIEK